MPDNVLHRTRRRSAPAVVLSALAAASAVALTLTGCSGSQAAPAPAESAWQTTTPTATGAVDSVSWNLLLEPKSLDPSDAMNYGENTVIANLCESLLTQNPDFTIAPGLATLSANADRTVLTLDIDPKATFWDGTPVTGDDAAYSLTRVWHPPVTSAWVGYFAAVTDIAATGDRQVTITLDHADLLLEEVLSTTAGVVLKRSAAEAVGDTLGTAGAPPMCSGPYRFGEWKQGSQLTIERNDTYWRGTEPLVREVVFTFLQGDATQTTALSGGAVQGMYNAPFTGLAQLAKSGQVIYGESPLTFFVTPTRKEGPLQDPRIRRALFLALDRAAVAKTAFAGAAVPARSLLSASTYGDVTATRSEGTGGSEKELDEARALVKDAGSPSDKIVIAAFTGISQSMNQTLQALVEAGQKIGLNIEFSSITLGEYYGLFGSPEGWKAIDADAFGLQDFVPVADPLALYARWRTPDNGENYGGFTNPELSAQIATASAEPDAAKRAALLSALDAALAEQMPWIPVTNVANVLYMDGKLTGPPASFVNFFTPWAAQLGATG